MFNYSNSLETNLGKTTKQCFAFDSIIFLLRKCLNKIMQKKKHYFYQIFIAVLFKQKAPDSNHLHSDFLVLLEAGSLAPLQQNHLGGLSKCRFGGHISDLLHQNPWRAPGNVHFIKQARWLITTLKFKNQWTAGKLQTMGTLRGLDSGSGDRPVPA